MSMDRVAAVRDRLSKVLDPELGASIVELGMIGEVSVDDTGTVRVEVALTTAACPLRGQIERDVREACHVVEGITDVNLVITAMDPRAKAELMDRARRFAQQRAPQTTLPAGTPVLALASGKGGVGKSSVAANLAVALAEKGLTVGVLDADVWGFSLPRLLGVNGPVEAKGGKMIPLERRAGSGRLRILSMGLLADEDQALLWRGLIVQRAVQQFIEDADWSGVDYLVVDTPPGTGDIAMALARLLPQCGYLIVTTPAMAAQRVAARAADFARRSNLRVLGVIENMSATICECGERHVYFGEGGGESLARELDVPLLASVPLRREVSEAGDVGEPAAGSDPVISGIFSALSRRIVTQVAPPLGAQGCTARLLADLERATSSTD
jgi:ATP-binding protein involved in chromosome partitioning